LQTRPSPHGRPARGDPGRLPAPPRRERILSRTAYAEVPPRVEYELTPLGESLRETLLALARWVTDHHDETETARHRYDSR
jgi:DNA-binding HxlR family transcriptional regulator